MLLVDIGNSRIKWTWWTGDQFYRRGQALYRNQPPRELLDYHWGELPTPRRVVVGSVGGPALARALTAWSLEHWHLPPLFVESEAHAFGVSNGYCDPSRLGVDRWLALLGARYLTSRACCIADCGTAITVDALDGDGQHQGGVILPGPRLMRQTLYNNTQNIFPAVEGSVTVPGHTTREGVLAGTVYAAAAAVDRLGVEMARQMTSPVEYFITGGDARLLLPYLENPYQLVPDLIFHGLSRVAAAT
ncbi:MAG: type III pantothenate kinase [Candidatus Competibacterales bacterium]